MCARRSAAAPSSPEAIPSPAPEDFARLLSLADAGHGPVDSPARRLQQELAASLAEPQVRRWPGAVRVGFILVASGALWTGLIAGALALS